MTSNAPTPTTPLLRPSVRSVLGVLTACLALLGWTALDGHAQGVVVAPTAVHLDHQTRSASITLINPGSATEEVTIGTLFGYPATDADGRLHLRTDDSGNDPRSAAGWIRAFPRQLSLAPGERRVVRLLGEPPADLDDGEYWARLVITSRGGSRPLGAAGTNEDIRVGLDMEVRTILSANYRKGPVSTGLDVEGFDPVVRDGRLQFRPDLKRLGSAAYIAELILTLETAEGSVLREWREQVAVYRDYHRAFDYDVGDLPGGNWVLRARFHTDRDDVPASIRLATEPVELLAPVRSH